MGWREKRSGVHRHIRHGEHQGTFSGTIVTKSATVKKVTVSLTGKCETTINGEKFACGEPYFTTKPLSGKLGYIEDKEAGPVGLKLKGENGGEIASYVCLATDTEFAGSFVGEFPELTKSGGGQYNKSLSSFELGYAASGNKQLVQTLLSSSGFEKGLHITAEGFYGGEASLEASETLKTSEAVEIKT